MHPIVNIAIKAARRAGDLIARHCDRLDLVKVTQKSRHNVVTEVDQLCELDIIQTIQRAYPDHSILAEESGYREGKEKNSLWIIDPLDGTTNFIHGLPHFAVSIAFEQNGRVEHGVIYDPIRQELFHATRGNGARLNDRRIRISQQDKLDDAFLSTSSPNPRSDRSHFDTFERVSSEVAAVRRLGSATLDLAYVAAGRLDGFWEPKLNKWDLAAGTLLVKEAGGLVVDYQGKEDYLQNGSVIAANPKLLEPLLGIIQQKS